MSPGTHLKLIGNPDRVIQVEVDRKKARSRIVAINPRLRSNHTIIIKEKDFFLKIDWKKSSLSPTSISFHILLPDPIRPFRAEYREWFRTSYKDWNELEKWLNFLDNKTRLLLHSVSGNQILYFNGDIKPTKNRLAFS